MEAHDCDFSVVLPWVHTLHKFMHHYTSSVAVQPLHTGHAMLVVVSGRSPVLQATCCNVDAHWGVNVTSDKSLSNASECVQCAGCTIKPVIPNAVFDCAAPVRVNGVCSGTCQSGFSGDVSVKCGADGVWEVPKGRCTPKSECRFEVIASGLCT
jgi:hypothetical protein